MSASECSFATHNLIAGAPCVVTSSDTVEPLLIDFENVLPPGALSKRVSLTFVLKVRRNLKRRLRLSCSRPTFLKSGNLVFERLHSFCKVCQYKAKPLQNQTSNLDNLFELLIF